MRLTMQLATYHYTEFHKIAIPADCVDLRAYMAGDEEGPELLVFWKDKKQAANDGVYEDRKE